MATAAPNPAPAPEKKKLFDTIVMSTPVLLTVIATFILGRSSSEMTQAQYQRALASQNQSKVGDQWAFFQAKRIRGEIYEHTVDVLVALKADPFTADSLLDAAEGLIREIHLTEKEKLKKSDPVTRMQGQLQALEKKADSELKQVKSALQPGKDGWQGKRTKLTPENVKSALDALEAFPESASESKEDTDQDIDADQAAKLKEILDDISKFKSEKEIAPKTLALNPETLEKAMEKAKAHAAAVSKRGKAIDRTLDEFDLLVEHQATLAREYQRALGSCLSAMVKSNGDADEIQSLERRLDRVRTLSARLQSDYKAARRTFSAQRYERDARSHQKEAYLYDVYVLQSSARSDKHLRRSFLFMIAMLLAQVGVTIASLAMMLKYRLPMWMIAALSGVIAIGFGLSVYLELAPLL